jgi:uncharacterized protein YbbK (DUF523 family)
MEKLLVSSCLLGNKVRYDGKSKFIGNSLIKKLENKYRVYTVCPELSGGLYVPRIPAERIDNKVISKINIDVTEFYSRGANIALSICHKYNIKIALLKENSPSCGVNYTYDGTFSGTIISGEGLTTELLRDNGIKVYSESEINKLF